MNMMRNNNSMGELASTGIEGERKNVISRVHDIAEQAPDSIAIECGNTKISYKELCRRVEVLSAMLWEKGVRSGDRVIIQSPNNIENIHAMLSIFCLGAIPIMTSMQQGSNEIEYIIEKCRPGYWFIYKDENIDIKRITNEVLKKNSDVTVVEINEGCWDQLPDVNGHQDKKHCINDKDLALILMSGGTSGVPKLIPRKHEDYFETSLAMGDIIGMSKSSVYLATMPISHTLTLYCPGVLGTLIFGGKVILINKFEYDSIIEAIKYKNVTITTLIPSLLFMLSDDELFNPINLHSLKVIQVGGAKLHVNLIKKLTPSISNKIQHVYGMSEGMHMCTRLNEDGTFQSIDKLKPVFSDDEVMINNELEESMVDEDAFELKVKGRFIIGKYYNSPEIDKTSFTREGFYQSGDLVTISPDGYYRVLGRKNNVIIRSGIKISSSKIEELVLGYPGIEDCQAFGVEDEYYGERIFVAVIKREGITANSINLFLKNNGASEYTHVDEIVEVSDWPKLPSGKIDKKELSKMFSIKSKRL